MPGRALLPSGGSPVVQRLPLRPPDPTALNKANGAGSKIATRPAGLASLGQQVPTLGIPPPLPVAPAPPPGWETDQKPTINLSDKVGSAFEMVGGIALLGIGTVADASIVGSVAGVAAQAEGVNLAAHGFADLFVNGHATSGFLSRMLQGAHVDSKTADRIDFGVQTLAGLGAPGAAMWKGFQLARATGFSGIAGAAKATGLIVGAGRLVDQALDGIRYSIMGNDKAQPGSAHIVQILARQVGVNVSPRTANDFAYAASLATPAFVSGVRAFGIRGGAAESETSATPAPAEADTAAARTAARPADTPPPSPMTVGGREFAKLRGLISRSPRRQRSEAPHEGETQEFDDGNVPDIAT